MGHQLVGRSSVVLETLGGLVTIADPTNLPEGASPRNWDIDFTIGGVNQRDGLYAALATPSPTTVKFLYAKTFLQPNGQINNLAIDNVGALWSENVNSNPFVLGQIFSNINPGSYMYSSTSSNREYMCFSDISNPNIQGDIPRQWAGPGASSAFFDRVSQTAPGAPPSFNASLSAGSSATITAWSITSNVVTFTAANSFTAGEIVTIAGLTTGSFMNNTTFTVSGTGLSGTQFEVSFTHANASATESGTATPQYSYPLVSITQNIQMGNVTDQLWSSGPGQTSPGTTATIYFQNGPLLNQTGDPILQNALNSNPEGAIIYLTGCAFAPNGAYQVTSYGLGTAPGAGYERFYLTFNMPSTGYQHTGGGSIDAGVHYQLTVATITAGSPIPNLNIGDQISITGSSVGGWNSTWTISQSLNGYTLSINATSMTNFVAKYYYSYVSGGTNGAAPANNALVGQLATVTGTLNGGGVFNVTDASIASNGSDSGGMFFTISGFAIGAVPSQSELNSTASTSGLIFQIDPGVTTLGTNTNPIFGNTTGGFASVTGGNASQFPLTAGTRQGVCLFVTRNGAVTPASTPVTFNTTAQSNFIFANNIPIGPPSTIARIIAITEAGQNGIAGQYFYYIPVPVKSVLNNVSVTYSATVIQDNTTTNAKFTFDDNTLLNATEIDITGLDYFNTVELGNAAWNIPYAGRMFYGLVQNKVYNFQNMSFDGGYIATGAGNNPLPAGWGIDVGSNPNAGTAAAISAFNIVTNVATFQCNNSFIAGQKVGIDGLAVGTYFNGATYTVLAAGLLSTQFAISFTHADVGTTADTGTATPQNIPGTLLAPTAYSYGNSYYIRNTTGVTQATFGMLTQSAYQDFYGVNILNPQVTYGVRVTARVPSGSQTGSLIVDLTTNNTATYGYSGYNVGYGVTYEAFVQPFSGMSTEWRTYEGDLLTTPFMSQVPPSLLLRVWAQNIANGADVEIKKIEVYPLTQPIGFPDDAVAVIGSYVNRPEAFDLVTGVIPLSQGNQQQVYGASVFNGILFFYKEESIVSTSQTPGQEPGNWAVTHVCDKVGAVGIYAHDKGKEYDILACRAGVFAFNGGEPGCINWEIRELWNAINWPYGRTVWVKNDIVNHKIYIGVPLPTPNQWLPNAPINSNPTTPNVVLVCNYLGLETFNELVGEPAMHVTMFGSLADLDMRRKWTIWNISSPNGAFLTRSDVVDKPIFFCNGTNSGKIYGLSSTMLTDDGAWINWDYCTYGFVNPAKSKENPLLGFHRKRYVKMQVLASGKGQLDMTLLVDDINSPPVSFNVWNKPNLTSTALDYVRNLNISGNRVFVEFSSGGLGTDANISRLILVGNMDLHAPMPNIPGR